MFSFLSAYILLIRLRLLPPQCLLSSPYQMSSCRQRAGTAYRCVHEGTVMGRHPLAANTDLRQHPAHDCLTGTRSLPCKKQTQTVRSSSSTQLHTLTSNKWKHTWGETLTILMGRLVQWNMFTAGPKTVFFFFFLIFKVLYLNMSGIWSGVQSEAWQWLCSFIFMYVLFYFCFILYTFCSSEC